MGAESKTDDHDLVAQKEFIEKHRWMIRPCDLYQTEYSECTSIKNRFDQYYAYGAFQDCSQWHQDVLNCIKWQRENDVQAAVRLVEHEQQTVAKRLKSFEKNNVMVRRTVKPPPGWNDPLPYHLVNKHEGSYLSEHLEDLEKPLAAPSRSCSIS